MCIFLILDIFAGDADDDYGGDAPTIFPSGKSPIPLRAGIKYPVRESLTSIKFVLGSGLDILIDFQCFQDPEFLEWIEVQ